MLNKLWLVHNLHRALVNRFYKLLLPRLFYELLLHWGQDLCGLLSNELLLGLRLIPNLHGLRSAGGLGATHLRTLLHTNGD